MIDDLNGMTVFAAIAEAKGFRAAGDRLGVSASALSQALRKLEERLGVALVRRSTRSVRLTEAGERLYASVRPALGEVPGLDESDQANQDIASASPTRLAPPAPTQPPVSSAATAHPRSLQRSRHLRWINSDGGVSLRVGYRTR